jgi:small subunit ribosomal protein S2
MPFVTERWLGGMLTNFNTVRKSVKKMQSIEKLLGDGSAENLTKKERLTLTRDKEKMEKVLGGIAQISRVPAALFLVDIGHEHIALSEAKRLNIGTFGMVDTNCDPNKVDFAIPANDDATKSIAIIVNYITAAIAEGLQERQADKEDDDHSDVEESAEAKAARFEQRLDGGDDRNKRSRGGAAAPGKRRVPGPGAGGRKPAGK